MRYAHLSIVPMAAGLLALQPLMASGGAGSRSFALDFLWILVIVLAAKLGGSLVERFGQPAVLGELLVGVFLGNLVLAGVDAFEPIKTDSTIAFLGEFGVIILLFQIGLESNIARMAKVGGRALLVAFVGVTVPFVLGAYAVGPLLMPGLSSGAYLFLGAALTATSVGITARVFKDLGRLHIPEAQIILGAAVIDDIVGLIILAVVSAVVTVGAISFLGVTWITAKAVLFLAGSIAAGYLLAPRMGKLFSRVHTGMGMKLTVALSFCLLFAYLANQIGLAFIVGGFAAGLVLDPVHFRHFAAPQMVQEIRERLKGETGETRQKIEEVLDHHSHRHVEDLVAPIGHLLVPIFFVVTGMGTNLLVLANRKILAVALSITFVAIAGKYVAGLAAGKVNKSLVGFGMAPRGEVGLIFATIGRNLGVVTDELFSVIVIMVILTTLLTPPVLAFILRRIPPSGALGPLPEPNVSAAHIP